MKILRRFVFCVLLVTLVSCSTYQQNNTQSQQIAVGNSFILRLSPEGTLYVSGGSPAEENRYHEVKILHEKKFKSIDASNSCAAAIDEEGNLYILGIISFSLDETPGIVSDDLASCLIRPIADKIAYVSVGEHHISAISESGKL